MRENAVSIFEALTEGLLELPVVLVPPVDLLIQRLLCFLSRRASFFLLKHTAFCKLLPSHTSQFKIKKL